MSAPNDVLRIAVASDDEQGLAGQVSAHFGRCPAYTVAEVASGQISSSEVVTNPHFNGHAPGVVPQFLAGLKPNVVLAGGMGPKAVTMLQQYGIDVATGMTGTVEGAIAAYLDGTQRSIVPCEHDHPESCGGH